VAAKPWVDQTKAQFTTDWRDLIADPEINLIQILTNPPSHAEICLAAIDAGKAVVCERTLATKLEDSVAITPATSTFTFITPDAAGARNLARFINANYTAGATVALRLKQDGFQGSDYRAFIIDTQPANQPDMLIRSGLPGDANLDGSVNFNDLLLLAQNYGQTDRDWFTGDFSLDGETGFTDLLALAQNYNSGTSTFQADWSLAQSLVPEPTLFCLIAAAPLTLIRRR
jgi:hypothetical protein